MDGNNTKTKMHQEEDMNTHSGTAENGDTNAAVSSATAEKSKALKERASTDVVSDEKSDEKVHAKERSGLQDCEADDSRVGESLQHEGLTSDDRHEIDETAVPLPVLRRQQQVRLSVTPGAFPVFPSDPYRNEDENERPIPNNEDFEPQDIPSSFAFTVTATLSPDEETAARGVLVRRPSYSSQPSSNAINVNSDCDIEIGEMQVAKLYTEEEEQTPFFNKWMIVGMVLVLLAVVVILALALAGVFGPNSVEDIDTLEALDLPPSVETAATTFASHLEEVLDRGYLTCHYLERPGFMFKNETTGEVTGFHSAWVSFAYVFHSGKRYCNSPIHPWRH
jgi:hypothetical protein